MKKNFYEKLYELIKKNLCQSLDIDCVPVADLSVEWVLPSTLVTGSTGTSTREVNSTECTRSSSNQVDSKWQSISFEHRKVFISAHRIVHENSIKSLKLDNFIWNYFCE